MEWTDPVTWIVIILLLAVTGGVGGRAVYKQLSLRPPPMPRRRRPDPESIPDHGSEPVAFSLPPEPDCSEEVTPTDPILRAHDHRLRDKKKRRPRH